MPDTNHMPQPDHSPCPPPTAADYQDPLEQPVPHPLIGRWVTVTLARKGDPTGEWSYDPEQDDGPRLTADITITGRLFSLNAGGSVVVVRADGSTGSAWPALNIAESDDTESGGAEMPESVPGFPGRHQPDLSPAPRTGDSVSPADPYEIERNRIESLTDALTAAVTAACPGPHRLIQHRDHRPPWCPACWRTADGRPIPRVATDA